MPGIAVLGKGLAALEEGASVLPPGQFASPRDGLVVHLQAAFPGIVFNIPLDKAMPTR